MKLKEVIKNACSILGLDGLKDALEQNSLTQAQQEIVDRLIEYFNRVQEEISSEFLPILHKENLTKEASLSFSELEKQILDVVYIKNEKGEKIVFTVYPDHISFDGEIKEILYTFVPDEAEINDDILFLAPVRIYAYAIAREYFLYEGLLDKAEFFEERFKNSINSLIEKDKERLSISKNLPKRLWI